MKRLLLLILLINLLSLFTTHSINPSEPIVFPVGEVVSPTQLATSSTGEQALDTTTPHDSTTLGESVRVDYDYANRTSEEFEIYTVYNEPVRLLNAHNSYANDTNEDRKSTRLNSSHCSRSRMPSSA